MSLFVFAVILCWGYVMMSIVTKYKMINCFTRKSVNATTFYFLLLLLLLVVWYMIMTTITIMATAYSDNRAS